MRSELTYFVHKVEEVGVKRFVTKVFANHLEDGPFQNERVVHGHKADALHTVPAGLVATSDARVHNVVRNEEVRLELER